MNRKKNIIKRRITGERASIFLETALVMPLFFIFLCIFTDLPRIMGVRQRLVGAGRLVSEIKARTSADVHASSFPVSNDTLNSLFFAPGEVESSQIIPQNEVNSFLTSFSLASSSSNPIVDALGFVGSLLGNIVSGGATGAFWEEIVEAAVYYPGSYQVQIKPLLPVTFYKSFADIEAFSNGNIGMSPFTCYMPNTDPCMDKSTPFARVGDAINDLIPDWLTP